MTSETIGNLRIERDHTMPLIEQVREITCERTDPDDMLDFIPAARALGASESEAEAIDETLTVRMMRANGAL